MKTRMSNKKKEQVKVDNGSLVLYGIYSIGEPVLKKGRMENGQVMLVYDFSGRKFGTMMPPSREELLGEWGKAHQEHLKKGIPSSYFFEVPESMLTVE